MSLWAKIESDSIKALKENKQLKLSVLRLLKSAVKNAEIEKKTKGEKDPLTEEEIIKVIKKEIKKREESIEGYTKGERADLVAKEEEELEILKEYAPKDLSDEKIINIVNETIQESNLSETKDFGQLMKLVMAKVGSQADGKKVSQFVREKLEK